jgi:hypothetical protein
MRSFLLVFMVACGSVDADPETCQDGVCVDSRFPFCDAEGDIGGVPNACIAVNCAPGDVATCRGDVAVTCNQTGDDYEMISCANGCDTSGCIPPPEEVECSTNEQCANPAPICSSEMTCRGCQSDNECPSTVCESSTGACLAEATIVYAAAGGSTSSSCTLANPCSIERAVEQATAGAGGRTLRMLPGAAFTTDIAIRGNTSVFVVAQGASTSAKLIVQNGASVDVRGLTLTLLGFGNVTCGDATTGAPTSSLALRDVTGANLSVAKCNLRMRGGSAGALSTTSDAAVEADSVRFTFGFSTISGQRVQVSVKNSILAGSINLGTSDPMGTPGSQLTVAFSTFAFAPGSALTCDVAGTDYVRSEVFENNVFFSTGGSDVVYPRRCVFRNNIMFPQATVIANNTFVDPQLVDPASGDYRLKATSPAINAAIPSSGLGTDHDFDGVMRPQGAAPDIGAFERAP